MNINRWLWMALLFHLIAVIFSVGFFHYDEHFQILEFAGYKLGLASNTELAWEYGTKIRPWLMPGIFTAIAKGWRWVGINDPFFWTASFRLLSGLIGWVNIVLLMKWVLPRWVELERTRIWIVAATAFFWALPFLDVRTSSESWAGSLFFIGFSFLIAHGKKSWGALATGLFWGLAFDCRYQTAILILPILLCYAHRRHLIIISMTAAVLLGLWIDHWGYGVWTFTPWHYFTQNILDGKASDFGVTPWWYYFFKLIQKGPPPLGLLILAGTLLFWIRNLKHPLTWVSLPFFLCHLLLPHKELRFLFPLVSIVPMMVVLGLFPWEKFLLKFKIWQMAAVFNFILLVSVCLQPANAMVSFYSELYRYPKQTVFYSIVRDPFDFLPLPVRFYQNRSQEFRLVSGYKEFAGLLEKKRGPLLFLHPGRELPEKTDVLREWCRQKIVSDWSLYECKMPALLLND